MSQLVRIGRICKEYSDFRDRHRILTTRLLKQGYKYDKLCDTFKRFALKYKDIFSKFRTTIKQQVKDGIVLPLNAIIRMDNWITSRTRGST